MRLSELPDGLHPNIPASVYHQREPGLASNSVLRMLRGPAAKYKAWLDGVSVEDENPAFALGTAAHCSVLEPELFAKTYVVEPYFGDCRKKENKAARDDFRATLGDKVCLSPEEAAIVSGITASVRGSKVISKLLDGSSTELTVIWTHRETGLRVKSRLDIYNKKRRIIADLKTCKDASPEGFGKSVANYDYDLQDSIYRMGMSAIGEPVDHFVFAACEKEPPYLCATYSLGADDLAAATARAEWLLRKMADCVNSGKYPGYEEGIVELQLPGWRRA